jgi:hypothetical protein
VRAQNAAALVKLSLPEFVELAIHRASVEAHMRR